MADFRLVPVAGLDFESYADPSSELHAGRLGDVPFAPHRHLVAVRGRQVAIQALIGEEEEPRLDSGLESPFRARWAEAPDGGPRIVSPSGGSAFLFATPTARGHYVVLASRPGAGSFLLHFDVEA